MDDLINIRQIIEKFYEYNITDICSFLYYTKAFDTVEWNLLWLILKEMRDPQHLIVIIKIIYVYVKSNIPESFKI